MDAKSFSLRKPSLVGHDFEYGLAASPKAPYLVYYLRRIVGGQITMAEHLYQLPELLAAEGHDGKEACYWLLNRVICQSVAAATGCPT